MKCPICAKKTIAERDAEFPFCSERCRLLDLGNWSAERYRISEPALEESADPGEAHERNLPGRERGSPSE